MSCELVSSKTLFILFIALCSVSNGQNNSTDWTKANSVNSEERNPNSALYRDCSNDDVKNEKIIPCSRDEDPFSETRDIIEDLRYGGEEGFTYSEAYQNRRVEGKSLKQKLTHGKLVASNIITGYETVLKETKVGESLKNVVENMNKKKLKTFLTKGLKVIGAIASVAQFVGPIFDIVMMFLPAEKSAELKAIETGFSETDAALDVLSLRLDQLEDKSDFNAIISDLTNFEASVDQGMVQYHAVAAYFDENEDVNDDELSEKGLTLLESLVNYVRDTGDIAKQLQFITKYILEGSDLAFNGERILSTFRRAEKNDCSKILPFGYRLLNLVRNAQKLQYFYELNQGIIDSTDDKGYPKVVYDIYVEVTGQYADCNRNVAKYVADVSSFECLLNLLKIMKLEESFSQLCPESLPSSYV